MAQIFFRRAMLIRRAICKKKGALEQFKTIIGKYASRCKERPPKWYYQNPGKDNMPPTRFLDFQAHPSTKAYAPNWDDEIQAMGPVGLLIVAATWNGLVIDNDLKIWQQNEEPIGLVNTPYQSLQPLLLMMAARARTLAEWDRRHHINTLTRGLREIEKEASQLNPKLPDEEKGIIRIALMGGSMAKQEIGKYNEDVGDACNYCKDHDSTVNHIRWQCKYFEPQRREQDPELAAVPYKYLLHCVQCSIAPAMKIDGDITYSGANFDEETDGKTKILLSKNMALHKERENADEAQGRKEVVQIVQDSQMNGRNARQTMLMHKQAHGSGVDLDFLDASQIEEAMRGYEPEHMVPVFWG